VSAETTLDPGPAAWAAALLESDRRYFEAGADVLAFRGASIAVLRGAESLAAGCVAQRIDVACASAAPDSWLAELEGRFRDLGASRVRLYLEGAHRTLDEALARRGYRRRVEHGFVRGSRGPAENPGVELVAADDDDGWSVRRGLVRRSGTVPDGLLADPDLWIDMERRRTRAGYMQPYLVRRGGDVVAAACAASAGPLLRIKNVIVDPAHRRRGVAIALAVRFSALAAEQGFAAAGCFAIEGEPGMGIYGRAGYSNVTSQLEWVSDPEGTA
jgi:ribosomal protein S18 acetylase RimI-like enzyme